MVKINVKIDEKSHRQFLTTPTGYTLQRGVYSEVDDEDVDIQNYLYNYDDVVIEETKVKQEKPKKKEKINEGSVTNTETDNSNIKTIKEDEQNDEISTTDNETKSD